MDRRRWLVVWLTPLALVLLAWVLLPFWVRHKAGNAAGARGFDLEIEGVNVRPTRLWLEGVKLQHRRSPALTLDLPWVEVRFGLTGAREVILHGGELRFAGDLEALRGELLSEAGPRDREPGSRPPGTIVEARGMFVDVRALESGAAPERVPAEQRLTAWGVQLRREGGQLRVSADLIRAALPSAEVELLAPHAQLALPELVVNPMGATSARLRLNVGVPGDATPAAPAAEPSTDPRAAPSTAPSKPPVHAAKPTPNIGLLSLDATRGKRWLARLEQAAGVFARRLPENGSFDLGGVFLTVVYDTATLNLGPAVVKGARNADELRLSATLASSQGGGTPFEIAARLPLHGGAVVVRAHGGPVSLSHLGVREGDLGLLAVDRARITADTDVELTAAGDLALLSSRGEVSGVTWAQRRVAREPLEDVEFSWAGNGQFALDGSRFELQAAEFGLGAVRISGRGQVEQGPARLSVNAHLSVSRASCQQMFESLPLALVPLLQGMHFRGMFSWQGGLTLDTDRLADSEVIWKMQNGCVIDAIPKSIAPDQFRGPFDRTVLNADGEPASLLSGPGTPDWVPFNQISRYLEAAVLTTEDGGFWNHRGFDHSAIEGSIRSNLEAGRFVRGASTISMQLAKNLYLSREKVLSRKIQEALLTMLLEQELRKDELLELYFNVVELAPEIYGVGPATQYYFNSEPAELSLPQAFYLASILPNPRVGHFEPNGELTGAWQDTLKRLMRIAEQRHRITREELEQGLGEEVRFGVPNLLPDDEATEDEWTRTVEDPWAQ
jgi:Transglycosylase